MPYALEHWKNKAIVTNTKTGKHYSNMPIPVSKAKAQLRILKQAEMKGWSGYKMIGMNL